MFNDYELNYSCIKKLKENDFKLYNKWLEIRNHYASMWFQEAGKKNILFVPHNYNDHSVHLYKIASDLIDSANLWEDLNSENLFCLNVAIMLHDIGMYSDPNKRYRHNIISEEMIEMEFKNTMSVLHRSIDKNQFYSINRLIHGHCDVKDERFIIIEETLKKPILKQREGTTGKINEFLLMGILRLIDELDIINERVHKAFTNETSFDLSDPNDIYSKRQWDKCEFLTWPIFNEKDRVIYLVPAEEAFNPQDEDIFKYGIELLFETHEKISNEFRIINETCFLKSGSLKATTFLRIDIINTNEQIYNEYLNFCKYKLSNSNFEETIGQKKNNEKEIVQKVDQANAYNNVHILHPDIDNLLVESIIMNKLIMNGHYCLTEDLHIRDWIDTQKIIENEDLMEGIYDEFTKQAKAICDDKTLIIGIDFQGIILASTVAFKIGSPFTYIISRKKENDYVDKEKEFININKYNKFIIFTDCIITGNTVSDVINRIQQVFGVTEDNILAVFTIILRKTEKDLFKISDKLSCCIYAITAELNATICSHNSSECKIAKHCSLHYDNIIYD